MTLLSRLRIPVLIAVLGLVLAACGGGGGTAATVDGVVITDDDIDALIADGVDDTPTLRGQALSSLIQWEIVSAAAEEDFGITVSQGEIDAELETLLAEFGGITIETFVEQQGITEDLLFGFLEQTVLQREIDAEFLSSVPEPTAEEIAAQRDENPTVWTEVCTSHILVETEPEADDVLGRLANGEDFAALATELSVDAGSGANGGDLGCTAPFQFVDPFAEATLVAEVGVPYGPVESEFGFHVILVESRTDASDEDIAGFLKEEDVLVVSDEWFMGAINDADVEVDESYGTWVTEPEPTIVPPVEE